MGDASREIMRRARQQVPEWTPAQVREAMIAQGLPPKRADAVLAVRRSGAAQRGMTVFPTVERITGRPPHSYAEWVDVHLGAFR